MYNSKKKKSIKRLFSINFNLIINCIAKEIKKRNKIERYKRLEIN